MPNSKPGKNVPSNITQNGTDLVENLDYKPDTPIQEGIIDL